MKRIATLLFLLLIFLLVACGEQEDEFTKSGHEYGIRLVPGSSNEKKIITEILVGRIACGSEAREGDYLREGDRVVVINGTNVTHLTSPQFDHVHRRVHTPIGELVVIVERRMSSGEPYRRIERKLSPRKVHWGPDCASS